METKEKNNKKQWLIWVLSACVFLGSVVIYIYGANNFVANYDSGVMHRYVFVAYAIIYFALIFVIIGRMNGRIKPVRWKLKAWNIIWNILYFFAVVFASLLIEELLWNEDLRGMTFKIFMINYALVAVIAIVLLLWIPKTCIAYGLTLVLNIIYGLINHFVREFKGCPPQYNDIFAAKTATTVMGSYTYAINRQIAYCVLCGLAILVFMIIFPPSDIVTHTKNIKKRVAFWVGRIVVPFILLIGVNQVDLNQVFGLDIYAWKPLLSFKSNGAPATMMISYQYSKPQKPTGYSEETAQQILLPYEIENKNALEQNGSDQKKPTIIAIMNESFSDMHVAGQFESDENLGYWKSMDSYVMRGYVYSSVWGGGTCNSEFEFLTGNSLGNARSSIYAYESYDLKDASSIVQYLNQSLDYNTVAFHPYNAENWNRPLVYDEFEFDSFVTIEDMTDPEYLSWTISDASDYEKVEQILDEHENEDQPLFIFNVTMQNHGGYNDDLKDGTVPVNVEEAYSGYSDVVNYLTLIRESDKALHDLLENLEKRDEPIIVCMFGDHQPQLNEEFMNAIDRYEGDNEIEEAQLIHITPYVIWSNYDTGYTKSDVDMSINYLGANLLEVAGYGTPYTRYLLDLQKEIPVINSIGYQTSDRQWHSLDEKNAALNEYKIVQYYELFGSKKK